MNLQFSSPSLAARGHLSLLHRLDRCAEECPEKRAVVFLRDGETETGSLTFEALKRGALQVAGGLASYSVEGRPVLLLSQSGLEFAVAFFGCIYAGAIAVPCSTGPRNRGWERIVSIALDASPAAALCDRESLQVLESLEKLKIPILEISSLCATPKISFSLPARSENAPALLQYTSGSTASPKGVIVTHRNLAANVQMIRSSTGISDKTVSLTWLPLFHDMGLIGSFITAIYSGATSVIMPPLAFYQRPQRWLSAISRYSATLSGGPNFAYEYCIRHFGRMDLTGIDLSHWETAFCGSEPVRPHTLRRFAELFSPTGFRPESFYPCYGLAESTLLVAGARGRVLKTAVNDSGSEVVSCGYPPSGCDIVVVDPDTLEPQPDGGVGEIWVSGDHVAIGYWNGSAIANASFAAQLRGDRRRFLRTGDLGWIDKGELYVSGRLKDLIIWRGAKLHPEDIEATVTNCCRGFGEVSGAFSIDSVSEERLIIVQELRRSVPSNFDFIEALNTISKTVADLHGAKIDDALLVRAGSIPRTTSGKVQRQKCREHYSEGRFKDLTYASIRSVTAR